jgi:catechol 2,3-dioxygenase-like lactoylglutathione lyase family enzyme
MDATDISLPRIQYVTITFPFGCEKRLREFYVGVLGLREKPTPKVAQPLGWIWFETGTPGVELHCIPDAEPIAKDTRHHFCLEIADLEKQRRNLAVSGCEIIEARALPLRPRFFARDPFNNLIEFVNVQGDYLAAEQLMVEASTLSPR